MNLRQNNFIEFTTPYTEADIVFIGIPYDGTASFKAGTRFAPNAVREASLGLEWYSPYQDESLAERKIADVGDIVLPMGVSYNVMQTIKDTMEELILKDNKKVFSFGGEHLVSFPIVETYFKKYPDLEVIHFDAHTDLREVFMGEKLSHANVIRLINGFIDGKKIHQFGIRSGDKHEFEYGKNNTDFNPFNLDNFEKSINKIDDKTPIYLTVDIDVLDPSIMPGTGTPEAGGVTFNELLYTLLKLKGKNVVGMDLVELSPDYDASKVSSIVAAKLVREMILLFSK